jgi:hypothetical protein
MNAAEELLSIHLTELGVYFQQEWQYAAGRRLRADFAVWDRHAKNWRTHGIHETTRLFLIEVQGGVYGKGGKAHGSITGILADIERLNQATLNGWKMLRFTPQQVENGEAKAMIQQAIGGKG